MALGLYSIAYRLLTILQESMLNVSANVAFPLYSRLREEPDRLTAGFRRASGLVFAIAAPLYVFLGIASASVIELALGRTWLPAASTMTALAFAGIATTIIEANNVFLQSVGRPGRVFALSVIGAAVNLGGFFACVRYGIFWVAVAFAARAYLFVPVLLWQSGREAGGMKSLVALYARLLPALGVAALGASIVGLVSSQLGVVAALSLAGPTTAVLYIAVLRLTAPAVFHDLLRLARTMLPARAAFARVQKQRVR